MKSMGMCAVFFLSAGLAQSSAQSSALAQSGPPRASVAGQSSVEFRTASGRLIGTVTTIGETTYYTAPDGAPLGTSSMVDGQRVFRSY